MMNASDPWTTLIAWTASALLHAATLGTALVLAADFSSLPRPRPFQWDITLVSAAPLDAVTSDVPVSSGAAPLSAPVSPASPVAEPSRADGAASATGTSTQPMPDLASAKAPSEEALLDRLATELLRHTPPELPPVEEIPLEREEAGKTGQPSARVEDTIVEGRPDITGMLPVAHPDPAELPPPDVDAPVAEQASEPAQEEPVRVAHRPTAQERGPVWSRHFHADYGWLVSLLHHRVERLKRYPPHAKAQRWHGQVLLQASIHADGRMDNVSVIKSSGYPLLDHDAVSLLERASPVTLKHPLGQSYVVLHIPIAYRLE